MAAVLEHSRVAHYLLSLGFVNPRAVTEEKLTVTDVSRRNTVFLATCSGGPSYVVKEPGPAGAISLAREAGILRGLAGEPALSGLIPELVHYDDTAVRLVLRSPARALDWGRQRRFSPLTARALGRALAAVHSVRLETEPLPPGDERLWGLSLPEPSLERLHSLSAGGIELLARVQADHALCDRLRSLREDGHAHAFIHGDLRWENCLVIAGSGSRRRTRVLLIDWELAGPGRPELDLAGALAEYVRTWVDAFPAVEPESDLSMVDAGSRRPLAPLQAAMLAVWRAYLKACARRVEMLRVTELAAVRLLETAFEYARGTPVVTGHVIVLAQIAANMLQAPGYAAWNLLGLRE